MPWSTGCARPLRVLTWNLQGSQGVDVSRAADVIAAATVDVVALQEVQRRQAQQLATVLGLRSWRWTLKHWPLVHRPEGLAVLTTHDIVRADRFVLRRTWWWSWRRRVGIDMTVSVTGRPARVIDVHLSPHDHDDHRRREARRLLARVAARDGVAPIIVGDLNELPGSGALGVLTAAGWIDAWTAAHEDGGVGATNWTSVDRRDGPPTQRIDYVLVPPGAEVVEAAVIDAAGMGELSDHVPLVVAVVLPTIIEP